MESFCLQNPELCLTWACLELSCVCVCDSTGVVFDTSVQTCIFDQGWPRGIDDGEAGSILSGGRRLLSTAAPAAGGSNVSSDPHAPSECGESMPAAELVKVRELSCPSLSSTRSTKLRPFTQTGSGQA
eukprot:COSAG06_NODE_6582_length_2870_cov_1.899314_3_plen_128_part_00